MRIALVAAGLGILTLVTAGTASADGIHLPGVNIQVGPDRGYAPPPPAPGYGYGPVNQGYGQPYGGGPPEMQGQDPREFTFHVQQRMNRIDAQLRNRVEQGFVRPAALGELQARRQDVENELQSAAADGVITPDEHQHIDTDLREMQSLDVRFGRNAYGGGPQWNDNPDWR